MIETIKRRTFLLYASACAAQKTNSRLSRENLLLFHAPDGSTKPVVTVDDWLKRRAEILRGMQEVMGPLPGREKRCPLDIRIDSEVDAGSHVRRLISYAAEPGGRVPAYLLVPKNLKGTRSKAPAVLCLHPTDHQVGHKVVVEPVRANRQYGSELADRGYVVIAPSYPQLAQYQPDWKALGYQSGTMKAIWDNIRGLDVLESLPYVRKGTFGAIGHSLGGHNSVYTAVFENRIRVIVSSCGLDSYLDYKDGDIRGWTSDRYMPKLLEYRTRLADIPFDFHEMVGALAPRVCFISAPLKDDNFKWQSVDRIAASAKQVYKLYGRENNLIVDHPDCLHDFPDEIRQRAYQLLDQHLR